MEENKEVVETMEAVVTTEAPVAEEKFVKKAPHKTAKKKVCAFCMEKAEKIDYKDVAKLRRYMTEKGKILPARQTYVCAKHQRELAKAIKRARNAALVAYKND